MPHLTKSEVSYLSVHPMNTPSSSHEQAMTLIEVILVVALLAGLMSYVVPTMFAPQDHSGFLRAFSAEVKSAYDTTVLTATFHRLVIHPHKRTIHLESIPPSSAAMMISSEDNHSPDERQRRFDTWSEEAPSEVIDHQKDRVIPPRSPLLYARQRLIGPIWQKVEGFGHEPLSWSSDLILSQYFVEHTKNLISLNQGSDQNLPDLEIFIHFYPRGYVERAAFIFRDQEDTRQPPYVVIIDAHQGVAEISTREEDVAQVVSESQAAL